MARASPVNPQKEQRKKLGQKSVPKASVRVGGPSSKTTVPAKKVHRYRYARAQNHPHPPSHTHSLYHRHPPTFSHQQYILIPACIQTRDRRPARDTQVSKVHGPAPTQTALCPPGQGNCARARRRPADPRRRRARRAVLTVAERCYPGLLFILIIKIRAGVAGDCGSVFGAIV